MILQFPVRSYVRPCAVLSSPGWLRTGERFYTLDYGGDPALAEQGRSDGCAEAALIAVAGMVKGGQHGAAS